MADEAVDDFRSSLADLTFNSKPLINMLTMLAEENAQYAEQIVHVIEEHIRQVNKTRFCCFICCFCVALSVTLKVRQWHVVCRPNLHASHFESCNLYLLVSEICYIPCRRPIGGVFVKCRCRAFLADGRKASVFHAAVYKAWGAVVIAD